MAKKSQAKIASVELFLNECYPCHASKYSALYDWVISQGIALQKFSTNRIPLSRAWLNYARQLKQESQIDAPFVVITTEDGEKHTFAYEDFLKKGVKMFSKADQDELRNRILVKKVDVVKEVKTNRKIKTKKADLKKDEVVSANIEE